MKFPTALLRDRITVEAYLGAGAYGPQYDTPRRLRARVAGRRRVVNRPDGSSVISTASAIVRDTTITAESRATWKGQPYEVLDVQPAVDGTGHTSHVELLLGTR